ncbi:hypothetical protein SRB5_59900 [Streptomyces sp. RB5]|uniref:DUF397 domain-containing protein n=1 Tax=Streptomyces smaragdinus TaxID=2585196 RepID=A0A7K0CQQ5_9ACTN|nr:DUF397 domain-containing protein [Streptomyces smaragdinus]MQY15799.1 hypothetical protein [Streptomyces smaragdinus]
MKRYDLPANAWRKSSYSPDNGGECVEIQQVDRDTVAVGDSKNRSQGAFVFSAAAWSTFVDAIKTGEL